MLTNNWLSYALIIEHWLLYFQYQVATTSNHLNNDYKKRKSKSE